MSASRFPTRLLDSGLKLQEIYYWTAIRTADVLSCSPEFGWGSTLKFVSEDCYPGIALKLYSSSCCKILLAATWNFVKFLGLWFSNCFTNLKFWKVKYKFSFCQLKKPQTSTTSSLTSTDIQSKFAMGIRLKMCLPRGYKVLGMETGTVSPEQGNCWRSVGTQAHLT